MYQNRIKKLFFIRKSSLKNKNSKKFLKSNIKIKTVIKLLPLKHSFFTINILYYRYIPHNKNIKSEYVR